VTVQKEVYKDEVVIEEVPVQTTRMERVVQKVSVPQKVMKTVPVTEIRLVPRTVTRRIPIDGNGNPIVVQSLDAPAVTPSSSPSDLPAKTQTAPAAAAPAAGNAITSKKPAITESGDLPAPSAPAAPPVPTESNSSTTELKIGSPEPSTAPVSPADEVLPAKSGAQSDSAEKPASDASNEKSGKIRVTGEE